MQKAIFVVDDSETDLAKVASVLETKYKVLTMTSPGKMFLLLEKGLPHMILLDIEIPKMNGIDVMIKLKANPAWQNIPVLFITGWTDEMILADALEAGGLDVISKPIVSSILLNRVTNYLNGVASCKK